MHCDCRDAQRRGVTTETRPRGVPRSPSLSPWGELTYSYDMRRALCAASPLSSLQRITAAVSSAFGAIIDPTRGDLIATLGETTGACDCEWPANHPCEENLSTHAHPSHSHTTPSLPDFPQLFTLFPAFGPLCDICARRGMCMCGLAGCYGGAGGGEGEQGLSSPVPRPPARAAFVLPRTCVRTCVRDCVCVRVCLVCYTCAPSPPLRR